MASTDMPARIGNDIMSLKDLLTPGRAADPNRPMRSSHCSSQLGLQVVQVILQGQGLLLQLLHLAGMPLGHAPLMVAQYGHLPQEYNMHTPVLRGVWLGSLCHVYMLGVTRTHSTKAF